MTAALRAVRALLKVALRQFGFRCESCRLADDGRVELVLHFVDKKADVDV
jgi:hypothetical protein